jgi:toxin FitB
MRAIIDTSVLIGADSPGDLEGAISAASLAQLHFGVLAATDEDERARRAQRLGVIEATFDPLPINAAVGREWAGSLRLSRRVADGRVGVPSTSRSRRPRTVHHVPLLTRDAKDFVALDELVDVRAL